MSNTTVFARVEQNKVIEYPVTLEQIQNRGAFHLRVFRPVQFKEKPKADQFFKVKEILSVEKGEPVVDYLVEPMTIQEILNGLVSMMVENNITEITPSMIPKEVFERVVFLAREEVGKRLDLFAKSRGYDNIVSLCSYATDPDEVHQKEAQRGVVLRSRAWTAIKQYEADVAKGIVPIPRTEEEIFSVIPAMTWED